MGVPGHGASWKMWFSRGSWPIKENRDMKKPYHNSCEAPWQAIQIKILAFLAEIFQFWGVEGLQFHGKLTLLKNISVGEKN